MQRRQFITRMLPAAAAVCSPWICSTEAHAAGAALQVATLAPGLSQISGGGGHVVVLDTTEGVLLIDGGSPEHSAGVLQTVRKLTGKAAVHTLFNTHWHWDQTGSNKTLGAAGTRIIAHENTRLWLGTEANVKWQQRVYPRLPVQARPNKTFYTNETLQFGGEQIDYGYLPQAHTDGDIYVHLRKANVIVAGDVLSRDSYPVIDYSTGGYSGGLADAAKALLQLGNEQTRYVPGNGALLSRADLQAQAEMLAAVQARLTKLLALGMSAQDMVDAAPTKDYDARWGDPTLFVRNAWPGLVARARELGVSIV
jgi:glyoxylase-like metal-dependent hydrolase (beta-lactamase superfamily II)